VCRRATARLTSSGSVWIGTPPGPAGLSLSARTAARGTSQQPLGTCAPHDCTRFKRHPLLHDKDQTVARVIAHGGSCVSVSSESTSSDERSQIVDPRTTAPRFKRHPLTCTTRRTKRSPASRQIAHGGSCVSSESTSSDERSQIVDPRPHADGTRSTRRPSHALV
jgi:hypothetical protein